MTWIWVSACCRNSLHAESGDPVSCDTGHYPVCKFEHSDCCKAAVRRYQFSRLKWKWNRHCKGQRLPDADKNWTEIDHAVWRFQSSWTKARKFSVSITVFAKRHRWSWCIKSYCILLMHFPAICFKYDSTARAVGKFCYVVRFLIVRLCFLPADKVNGEWQTLSYQQYYQLVSQAAKSFIKVWSAMFQVIMKIIFIVNWRFYYSPV